MSTYGPAGPVNPDPAGAPYPPGGESQPNPWEEETRPYQNPAPSSVPPAAPGSPAYGQQPVSPPAAYPPQPVSGQPQPVSPPAYPSVPQQPAYPQAPPAPQYQPPQPAYPQAPPAPQYQPPQQGYASPPAPYQPVAQPPYQQAPEPGFAQPNAGFGQQNYSVGQASASAAVPRPYDQGYGQQGDYDQQWPAEPKKRNTAVIVLSILLGVVLIGGGATAAFLYANKGSDTPSAPPKAQTCVVSNKGTPVMMVPVSCGPGTFQIVSVLTGTSDTNSCPKDGSVSDYYTFTWPPNSAYDYVLCLKKQ